MIISNILVLEDISAALFYSLLYSTDEMAFISRVLCRPAVDRSTRLRLEEKYDCGELGYSRGKDEQESSAASAERGAL